MSQKLKKKNYWVSPLCIVLQADWIDLLTFMVYLTMLLRANITRLLMDLPLGSHKLLVSLTAGAGLNMRRITSPYKTICINK
jgi:hypothetical protein